MIKIIGDTFFNLLGCLWCFYLLFMVMLWGVTTNELAGIFVAFQLRITIGMSIALFILFLGRYEEENAKLEKIIFLRWTILSMAIHVLILFAIYNFVGPTHFESSRWLDIFIWPVFYSLVSFLFGCRNYYKMEKEEDLMDFESGIIIGAFIFVFAGIFCLSNTLSGIISGISLGTCTGIGMGVTYNNIKTGAVLSIVSGITTLIAFGITSGAIYGIGYGVITSIEVSLSYGITALIISTVIWLSKQILFFPKQSFHNFWNYMSGR